jgi:hypothetical protein
MCAIGVTAPVTLLFREFGSGSVEFFDDPKANSALVGYHGRLKGKDVRAAHFPWSPDEADPPEPK